MGGRRVSSPGQKKLKNAEWTSVFGTQCHAGARGPSPFGRPSERSETSPSRNVRDGLVKTKMRCQDLRGNRGDLAIEGTGDIARAGVEYDRWNRG